MSTNSAVYDAVRKQVEKACETIDLVLYCEKANVTFTRHGQNERRSACPLCGAGGGSKTVFRVRLAQADWACFACGQRGDVVSLHQILGRFDKMGEAARDLLGSAPADVVAAKPKAKRIAEGEERDRRIAEIAAKMWSAGQAFEGSPGEAYLIGRGVDPEVVAAAAPRLRFHVGAKHHWDGRAQMWVTAPAMVAQVTTPGGWTGGVHATYLAPDGSGKADLPRAKMMWGPQIDELGRRGGAWLIGPDGADLEGAPLAEGEGIESTLSLASWLKARGRWPLRSAAALTLLALQGGPARDAEGCIDVWDPQPDPKVRPFTWPPPAGGWGAFIGIDRDMKPQKYRGRTGRGKPVDFVLGPEDRAALCARLAGQAWKAAGADPVRAMWPGPRGDWNDLVKRQALG